MIAALAASACVLLAVAGLAKLRAPGPAVTMLVSGWPGLRRHRGLLTPVVRAAAVAEIGVAVAVLAVGGRIPPVALCVTYLLFAGVSLRLARRGGSATSCGCFGRADSPVGRAHVTVNLLFAAAAGAAVALPDGRLAGLTHGSATAVAVGSVQILLLAYVAYLALTALPALAADRRRLEIS